MSDTQPDDMQPDNAPQPDNALQAQDMPPPHAPDATEPTVDLSSFRLEMGHVGDFLGHIKTWVEWRLGMKTDN